MGNLPIYLVFILMLQLPIAPVLAQESAQEVPERTNKFAAALANAAWERFDSGLEILRSDAGAVQVTALRIDPAIYEFSLAVQSSPDGERVIDFGARKDADIAINGGFFGEKEPGKNLFPVGYLQIDGTVLSQPWLDSGGFLVFGEGKPAIFPSADGVPARPGAAIQSKPLLIEPGGQWAMNTNLRNLRRRSLVCLQSENRVVLVVIAGIGMSLYEAGWLLRGMRSGGFFDCDAALALDGGGSTQLWVRGDDSLNVIGDNPIHNAILVKRRH
jgi:exopolysaccharide biosynthesis protein